MLARLAHTVARHRKAIIGIWVVLSLVVCLGLTLGGKAQSRRWPRFSVEDVHRFGGLLVGSLLGVHILAIAADSFLPFSLTQLLVPFTSTYRPLWTGLGIAAAEVLVALAITNHYRRSLPYSFWRKAHSPIMNRLLAAVSVLVAFVTCSYTFFASSSLPWFCSARPRP